MVRRFGLDHPSVEIRVWDLTHEPGPATRRGIFATPSVLLNDQTILIGVPTEAALTVHLSTSEAEHPSSMKSRVLIINAYGAFLRRPVTACLEHAGYEACPTSTVVEAVAELRRGGVAGLVVALNLGLNGAGAVTRSGLGVFAELRQAAPDPELFSCPIVVTATFKTAAGVVQEEARRHGIANPILLAAKSDVLDPAFGAEMRRHFESAPGTPDASFIH